MTTWRPAFLHARADPYARDVPENDSSPEDEPLLLDKRLLMEQGEFASVLKMLTRDGNILSDILRQMWDGSTLGTLTKQSPERASRTHGSIVGHISREELLRYARPQLRRQMASVIGFYGRVSSAPRCYRMAVRLTK